MTIVALVPARAGSQRIKNKNTRLLAGRPLVAYTIAAAQQSGIFREILVCTDDPAVMDLARTAGVPTRHRWAVPDDQPDIDWVRDVVAGCQDDAFAILRPTSPFRTAATIQRAWAQFQALQPADSLRAVEPWTGASPFKMWRLSERKMRMVPLIANGNADLVPWHSTPTQTHPAVYLQNASLEIAWTRVIHDTGTISGATVIPFLTEGHEGLDVNLPEDLAEAERLIAAGVPLPPIPICT